ncbi:MAG: DUF503 domain-containing protein [Deltaproteobacteria bacterium]|jgi:uncharacterized protein YlxP (DUF503 family)|nr:DUF503 domain-containing protein [Deltaproteobacteria bacterium]
MAVFVGILRLEFRLHGNESLKDKRRVALSLKQKIRNKFNVSVAETGSEDSMDYLCLSVASVCNEKQHLESRLAKCLNMAQAACDEELVYDDIEIIAVE